MARWFSFKPTLTLKGRKFKGLRGFSGKPFHPPLTDVPVTAYILAAIFDVISVYKGEGSSVSRDFFISATHVMIAGAIVSGATALTGFWDWFKSTPKGTQARRTANTHMLIMLTVTALVIVDIVVRLGQWDEGYTEPLTLILSLVIAALVSLGATYGGELVYEFGFNVEQGWDKVWEKSEEDIYPKDVNH